MSQFCVCVCVCVCTYGPECGEVLVSEYVVTEVVSEVVLQFHSLCLDVWKVDEEP